MKFGNKVIVGVAIFLVIFSQEVLFIMWHGSQEPAALIAAVFGAGLGEFGILAWIKTVKIKKGEHENE